MIKKYVQFINENMFTETTGKLFVEDGEGDGEWKLTIDVTTIWQDYSSNKISLVDFNNQYATYLINQSETITQSVGASCWNELEPVVVNELRQSIEPDPSESIYNKIYDICDHYEVLLKTGQEEQTEQIEEQPQNNEMNDDISTNF